MSKKLGKFLLTLAGIGAIIGIIIAFFQKKSTVLDEENEFSDDFEDEDFDLDSDLEPVSKREYVSLNKSTSSDADIDKSNVDENDVDESDIKETEESEKAEA